MEVGRDKKHFTLSTHLLITKSEYFHAALTGEFRESSEKRVCLEDIDAKDFKYFVSWPYNETAQRLVLDDTLGAMHVCIRLYVLAERFACTTLLNQSIDTLIMEQKETVMNADDFQYGWECTAPESKLKTLLMDFYLNDCDLRELLVATSPDGRFSHTFFFAVARLHKENGNHGIYRLAYNAATKSIVQEYLPERCRKYHVHTVDHERCEEFSSFAMGPEEKWKALP